MSLLNSQMIGDKELHCLVRTVHAELHDKEKMVLHIECIEDLLSIYKLRDFLHIGSYTRSGFLKKDAKRHVGELLDDRIMVLVEQERELEQRREQALDNPNP